MNVCLLLSRILGSKKGPPPTPTYTISGTIVDGASAGIEGVTVALTGDATDSTTTAADGTYSFTGVVDGSYTVTPTFANLKMTPASREAVVSGANVALDNIVGQYLLLPYTYNMSDVTPTSGGVAAQIPGWSVFSTYADASITTSVADNNSYTPTGVTKGFSIPWNGTQSAILRDLVYVIDPSLTGLRVAHLFFSVEADRPVELALSSAAAFDGTSQFAKIVTGTSNPDTVKSFSRYEEATSRNDFNDTPTGVNQDCRRYHWSRLEYDFVADKVRVSCVRAEDSSSLYALEANMSATGVTLGHVPANLRYLRLQPHFGVSTPTVVKFWIGTASDDWPT